MQPGRTSPVRCSTSALRRGAIAAAMVAKKWIEKLELNYLLNWKEKKRLSASTLHHVGGDPRIESKGLCQRGDPCFRPSQGRRRPARGVVPRAGSARDARRRISGVYISQSRNSRPERFATKNRRVENLHYIRKRFLLITLC